MLTNLEWIGPGKVFPPEEEKERIKRYEENEKLFLGAHMDVFGNDFARIENELKKRHMRPMAILNYPQLISKKTADFVCGEAPVISAAGEKGEKLGALLAGMNFEALLYEAAIDISRFGDAPIRIAEDGASLVPPMCWFPVVRATDVKKVMHHVVAFLAEGEIYVEIHTPGSVRIRRYEAKKNGFVTQFGALLYDSGETRTGLDDFAVKVLKNVGHSRSVFGMDDYGAIKSIVEAIVWRLACIDRVLDKHSEPSMSGPAGALSFDERTGMYYLDLGNYFKRNGNDDANVEYITWDGNLDAAFSEIEFLVNQLYVISEMGAAFLEGSGKQGTAQSGTALRLRMTSPRIKAGRIAGVNKQAIRQLVALVAQAGGIKGIEAGDISIKFNDGLPDDMMEKAQILSLATGGRELMSQKGAVIEWNGAGNKEAQEILGEIHAQAEKKEAELQNAQC